MGYWTDWERTLVHKNVLSEDALIMSNHILLGVINGISKINS